VGVVAWSVPTFTITAPLVIVWRKSSIATTIAYIRYAAPLVVDVPAYRENEVRIYPLETNRNCKIYTKKHSGSFHGVDTHS
jgi:hypothetical protein